MLDVRGAWTEADAETFLHETTIPIRLATRRPDGSLWLVALWDRYRDGALECATSATADLVQFLRHDPELAFDISTNDVPYRGIRGAGTAEITPDDDKSVLRELLERYLGDTDSPLAERLLDEERDEVRIRILPQDVYSWDDSDRMGAASSDEST